MRTSKNKRFDPLLMGIALLAAFLNIFGIWTDQYANAFYTSAVVSMLQSFHNFFFASFDPGGFVTVDKPPVAFWFQTLSASLFGVHGWSVILPQALAGVGSVLLIYILIKPSFGKTAARLSALVLACTPIAAAVSRTNNVDSLLVFDLLIATWLLFKAVKTKKWTWSVAAFAVVGIGFNIKMLEAYMILPAFYVFYWVAFKVDWKKKLKILTASTAVLLVVSFSWALIVDSIPAADRPYIGSSQTNSVLELAFGYNGISRLTGMGSGVPGGFNQGGNRAGTTDHSGQWPKGGQNQANGNQIPNGSSPMPGLGSGQNGNPGQRRAFDFGGSFPGPMGAGGPGSGGLFNTGKAGPLRLFQSQLSGQISWLLPFALLSAFGLLLGIRRRKQLTAKQTETLFWLAWLLPIMAFFSVAGFFHQYYLVTLAPAIAALTGAGWAELYGFLRNREGWKRWLLPVGILGTTLFQIYVLMPYEKEIGLVWPLAVGIVGIGLSLILCLLPPKDAVSTAPSDIAKGVRSVADDNTHQTTKRQFRPTLTRIAAVGGILVLLAAPLYWAMTPLLYGGNDMMPAAGPQLESSGRGGGMPGQMQENVDTKLLNYLTTNNTGEKFLFATTDSQTAEPYIIKTGKAVMAMGGFSGSDPILTVDKLKQMVENKEVKYFLISSSGFGRGGSSEVLDWIRQNGKAVPQSEWQSSTGNSQRGMGRDGSLTLYEVNP